MIAPYQPLRDFKLLSQRYIFFTWRYFVCDLFHWAGLRWSAIPAILPKDTWMCMHFALTTKIRKRKGNPWTCSDDYPRDRFHVPLSPPDGPSQRSLKISKLPTKQTLISSYFLKTKIKCIIFHTSHFFFFFFFLVNELKLMYFA